MSPPAAEPRPPARLDLTERAHNGRRPQPRLRRPATRRPRLTTRAPRHPTAAFGARSARASRRGPPGRSWHPAAGGRPSGPAPRHRRHRRGSPPRSGRRRASSPTAVRPPPHRPLGPRVEPGADRPRGPRRAPGASGGRILLQLASARPSWPRIRRRRPLRRRRPRGSSARDRWRRGSRRRSGRPRRPARRPRRVRAVSISQRAARARRRSGGSARRPRGQRRRSASLPRVHQRALDHRRYTRSSAYHYFQSPIRRSFGRSTHQGSPPPHRCPRQY